MENNSTIPAYKDESGRYFEQGVAVSPERQAQIMSQIAANAPKQPLGRVPMHPSSVQSDRPRSQQMIDDAYVAAAQKKAVGLNPIGAAGKLISDWWDK